MMIIASQVARKDVFSNETYKGSSNVQLITSNATSNEAYDGLSNVQLLQMLLNESTLNNLAIIQSYSVLHGGLS